MPSVKSRIKKVKVGFLMVLFFAKIFFKIMNILIPPNIGSGIDSENIVNKVL